ncbi:MAG: heparinase II/III family protein [Alphaproteobacteria bacterium]|nr:heparinase II/III family protein [Alphaproteobacteria bacterium]
MARPPDPPGEDADASLRRDGGDRGFSLAERAAASLASRLYASPLHRLRLRGRFPLKLLGVPVDPVPGDAGLAERIMAGRLVHAGHTVMIRDLDFRSVAAPLVWQHWAQGWGWLRHLAILPDRKAAIAAAEHLGGLWLAAYGEYDPLAWRADLVGQRLLMVLGHAPVILGSGNHVFRSAVLAALATWARHLDRAAPRLPDGLGQAQAWCGQFAAGTLIPGGEVRAARALAGLEALLPRLVLPDGGIASRAPGDALALAELLLFTASASETIGNRAPLVFADTLARLVPALRGLSLGDGRIGSWHGSAVIAADALDRLARKAATGTELRRSGRWSGYHRLSAGRSIVIIDAGPPPPARLSGQGHAGTLAFEMSDGPERLISNCGGAVGLPVQLAPALATGLATTAAHSTLVVADTNSTRIRADGTLAAGVGEVTLAYRSTGAGQLIDAAHDGYARRFGLLVRRRLFLAADGNELAGEEVIAAAPVRLLHRRSERPFDVRFHLAAGVSATPTADGMGALLKTPAGRIWAFKASGEGCRLTIEPSLWVDEAGTVHRTQQLVVSGQTAKAAAELAWSLRRAGKQG